MTENNLELDESGQYVQIDRTKKVEVPISNQIGSQGEFNYNKLSGLIGTDIYDYIEGLNQQRMGGKAAGGTNSTGASINADAFFALPFNERTKYRKSGNSYIPK